MLHLAIAAGLVAGLAFGLLAAATGSETLLGIAAASAPLGTAFMNGIRMVVIPLVMAVIFSGVAKLGDPRKLGKLGFSTLAFFWTTLVPAILIGMGAMRAGLFFAPGVVMPEAAPQAAPELPGFVDFLVSLIPSNPFAAASSGALLPLILFIPGPRPPPTPRPAVPPAPLPPPTVSPALLAPAGGTRRGGKGARDEAAAKG